MRLLRNRRIWIGLGLVALVVAIQLSPLGELLTLEALGRHRATLLALVAGNPLLAAAAYVAIYVVVISAALPGATILSITGGMLFGAALGGGLTVVAATVGAVSVFLLARRLFGADALDRLGPSAQRIAAGLRRDAASYLLVLRLVPLFPFFLVNIVPAFCGIRPRLFALTTFFGIMPGTLVYSLAGAGLGEALAAGGTADLSQVLTPKVLGALALLALLALAAIPLRRRFAKD
jgi:uncharacterized membrane protein YdjX (TVP38/TMEM64 family)